MNFKENKSYWLLSLKPLIGYEHESEQPILYSIENLSSANEISCSSLMKRSIIDQYWYLLFLNFICWNWAYDNTGNGHWNWWCKSLNADTKSSTFPIFNLKRNIRNGHKRFIHIGKFPNKKITSELNWFQWLFTKIFKNQKILNVV